MKEELIAGLEREWDLEVGALGRLRRGLLDQEGLLRLEQMLKTIPKLTLDDTRDQRLVALTWFIPLFMTWQKERVEEQGGDGAELELFTNRAFELVTEILGAP